MRNLRFKQLLILSNIQKSANQFTFQKRYNLITANENTRGKSTLVKLLLWCFGSEPSLDDTWKNLNCKVLVQFSLKGENYTILRNENIIYWKKEDEELKKYYGISGEFSEMFAALVGFSVLLPKRVKEGENSELITPPPAYYFLPFYIDQKKSWSEAWNNFESLSQFANWKKIVIQYHVGYIDSEHFKYEKEYLKEQIKVDEFQDKVKKMDTALEVVSDYILGNEITLDNEVFEKMTEEIEKELLELSNTEEELLKKLTESISDKVYLEHQVMIAEKLMKELDDDYTFSFEHFKDDFITCPLCGTEHENSVFNKASILVDKNQAQNQLNQTLKKLKTCNSKIEKLENESNDIKKRIDEINAKYTLNNGTEELKLNQVIENFAYKGIDRKIDNSKKDILLEIDETESTKKGIKKEQKKLLTKERKEEINNAFIDLLNRYIRILDIEAMNLAKVKTPLNYNSIVKEGGASESTRGILAYYLSIFSLVDIYGSEIKAPLIIDTPNQQEQSDINYQNIIELITTKIPDEEQIFLCALNSDVLSEFKNKANVIELDEKMLLDKSKYQSIKKAFDNIER